MISFIYINRDGLPCRSRKEPKNENMKFDPLHINVNRIELRHKFVLTVKGKSEAPWNILSVFVASK